MNSNENIPKEINQRWYKQIRPTVEPTMFLYMMSFMITSVVEQAYFVYKACKVNHGYSEEICLNLELHDEEKKIVQQTVSTFHLWNNVLGHIVPIILALFFGSWSDRRGRKLPLLLGLAGKFIYSSMFVLNTYQNTWPVEYIIYTATIPSALTGADVAIFAACFSYISDVSTVKNRTIRVTILDVIFLSTMPTGVAIGAYLFNNVFGRSYSYMFILNASFIFLSIVYSFLALKWQTTTKQRPITELSFIGMIKDYFDKNHVIDSFKTLSKKRDELRRLYLWIFMVAMALYTFQRDEKPMTYLYTQLKFNWDVQSYSDFKVFQSTAYVVAMLVGVPIFSKLLGFRDTTIVMIGAFFHASARVFFAFAEIPEIFYVGGAISSLGPIVAPVLRSMTSKVVPENERGKVFALLSVCDNAIPMFSGVLYSKIYISTINTYPPAIFWLTFSSQVLVLILSLVVHVTLGPKSLVAKEPEKPDLTLMNNDEKESSE